MLLVGLVGYTNAGKSSLQNALAGSAVASVNDRLFETLDTSIRRVDLGERTEALISDTVGFINDLPTELVSAFRATLEETVQADLLVEVLDAADPLSEDQHETVDKVLKDLGIRADKPRLLALNKWDLTPEERRRELVRRFPEALPLSAVTGEGVDELREELRRLLSLDLVPLTVRLPYNRLELLHIPPGQGRLISTSYEFEDVVAKVRVHPRLIERLRPFVVSEPCCQTNGSKLSPACGGEYPKLPASAPGARGREGPVVFRTHPLPPPLRLQNYIHVV
jgi:GTP-binding protein HflX